MFDKRDGLYEDQARRPLQANWWPTAAQSRPTFTLTELGVSDLY